MESILQDLHFAVRQLLKHRAFTAVALVTLALGIGANTAIFSVVDSVLLKPLPYPQPDRLVTLSERNDGQAGGMGVWYREYQFLRDRAGDFDHLAATTPVGMNLAVGDAAEHLAGLRVSRDYFHVLGVPPAVGRDFAADEDQPSGPDVLILSHDLWMRRFGADPAVGGRVVQIDGRPTTIIGVMPAGFHSLPDADAWSTLAQVSATIGSGENLEMIGRLRRGVTLEQANARSGVMFADFHTEFARNGVGPKVIMAWAPYLSVMVQSVQTPVQVLFGAIGFVLLIACANVASLLLGRTAARRRELAVRIALGASRTRIARQIVSESLVLAVAGGALAIVVAAWVLHAIVPLMPPDVPRSGDLHLDFRALGFTIGVTLVTGLMFGLVPALQAIRRDPGAELQQGGTRSTGSAEQGRVRNVLVVSEVAVSLLLLSGAGLMIRTVANLMHTDPGFDPRRVMSAELWLTGSRYDSAGAAPRYYRELVSRLDAVPGVQSAAVVEAGLPLERGGNMAASVEGGPFQSNDYRTITPGYFATLGVRVAAGRDINETDNATSQPVVVVNRSFAHKSLDDHPLGRTLTIGGDKTPRTVVGVVGDVKSFIGFDAPPTVYLPSAQTAAQVTRVFNGWFPIHVLVRATGDPAGLVSAVRRTMATVDPDIPIGRIRPLEDVLGASVSLQRFVSLLLTLFAALAVVLAMVGIYGLISWFVVRHHRDIGVRIALGASPGGVQWMVVRRGLILAGVGAVLGLAGAAALTRLLASLLYDVRPADPITLVAVSVLVAGVAVAASYLPARRAARVDPIVAMRAE